MKNTASFLSSLIGLCITLTVSCAHNVRPLDDADEADHNLETRSSPIDQFWQQFRAELRDRDVSRSTNFPINIDLAEMEGFECIENRPEFVRHFNTIFPESAIRTLLRESPTSERDDISESTSWVIVHNEPNNVSEREWSIIYRFTRTSTGTIKLTAVHFAG